MTIILIKNIARKPIIYLRSFVKFSIPSLIINVACSFVADYRRKPCCVAKVRAALVIPTLQREHMTLSTYDVKLRR